MRLTFCTFAYCVHKYTDWYFDNDPFLIFRLSDKGQLIESAIIRHLLASVEKPQPLNSFDLDKTYICV